MGNSIRAAINAPQTRDTPAFHVCCVPDLLQQYRKYYSRLPSAHGSAEARQNNRLRVTAERQSSNQGVKQHANDPPPPHPPTQQTQPIKTKQHETRRYRLLTCKSHVLSVPAQRQPLHVRASILSHIKCESCQAAPSPSGRNPLGSPPASRRAWQTQSDL